MNVVTVCIVNKLALFKKIISYIVVYIRIVLSINNNFMHSFISVFNAKINMTANTQRPRRDKNTQACFKDTTHVQVTMLKGWMKR